MEYFLLGVVLGCIIFGCLFLATISGILVYFKREYKHFLPLLKILMEKLKENDGRSER